MQNRSPWPSILGAALLLGACEDTTEPTKQFVTLKASSNDTECTGALTGPVPGDVVVPPGGTCVMEGAIVQGDVRALEGSILNMLGNNVVFGNVEGVKTRSLTIGESVVHGDVKNRDGRAAFIFLTRLTNGDIELRGLTSSSSLENNTLDKGNVRVTDAEGGVSLNLSDNGVAGNVRVSRSFMNNFSLTGNGIGGELEVWNNQARFDIEVSGNTVGGNLEVRKNIATVSIQVTGNNVGEDLRCRNNTAAVFIGQPNLVAGDAEGQCAVPGA